MVPLETVFIGMVIFFGIVGALRGWAKELLVTFSVFLARFIEFVLWKYVPVINASLQGLPPGTWFYVRLAIFGFIIFFGYATTAISERLGGRARKEKLQDTLLGFFIGGINGFLIVGTLWGFIHELGYNIWGISEPTSLMAQAIIRYLPTVWLHGPLLLVTVAFSFAFVLIVFV